MMNEGQQQQCPRSFGWSVQVGTMFFVKAEAVGAARGKRRSLFKLQIEVFLRNIDSSPLQVIKIFMLNLQYCLFAH